MKVARSTIDAALGAVLTTISAAIVVWGVVPAVPTLPPSEAPASARIAEGRTPAPVAGEKHAAEPTVERVGSDLDTDDSMPASALETASYTIRARLDPVAHTVDAQGEIAWTNRSTASVQTLFVHAYLNAFKDEGSTFLTSRLRGGRGSGALRHPGGLLVRAFVIRELGSSNLWPLAKSADEGNPYDQTDLAIDLPRAITPGETIHVDMEFEALLPQVVERTGYFDTFHMVAQWFPKIARLEPDGTFAHFPYRHLSEFYADFGSYDVTVDVPEGFRVGAVGRRVEERTSAGRYVSRYVQRNIHDFAFAAYDRFEEVSATDNGIALRCLVPRGYEAVGRQELDAAIFGLRTFGRLYGAYPYETLTIVHPPPGAEEAGGMEYPTLITTGGPWYASAHTGLIRSLTLHELAHQYFYGLVATDEQRWPFLDEGLATFAEVEALDAGWGEAALWSAGWSTGGTDALLRYLGLPSGHDDIIAQPADAFVSWRSYGLLAYARTALLMRTIDRAYESGAGRRALGRYARRYRFEHPGPSHLLGAVRDTVGEPASRQLAIGLFDRGWVDYAISDARCEASMDPPCTVVVTRRGTLVFPVDIVVIADDGSAHRMRWNGDGRQVALPVPGVAGIASVVIDPEHRVLVDEDLANNALRMGQPSRAWRVWDRATYALALAAHLVAP